MAAWPVGGSFWVSHSGTHSRQHTQRTPPSPLTKSPQTQETSNCTTGGRERAARTLMTIDVRPRALMPSCGQRQGAGRPQNQLGPSLLLPGAVCAQDPSPRHSQPCSKTSYVHPRERYWQCRAAGHHRAESQHPDQKPEPPPPPPHTEATVRCHFMSVTKEMQPESGTSGVNTQPGGRPSSTLLHPGGWSDHGRRRAQTCGRALPPAEAGELSAAFS